jgi:hypothetical protein
MSGANSSVTAHSHKVMRRPLAILATVLFVSMSALAQRGGGGRGGPAGPPPTGRGASAVDLTGYWVSVINEDWRLRMITPPKGQFDALTLNAEGRRVGNTWDPDRDEKAGEQCKAYGAPAIMRLPGRLHITWENENTLRIDTDTGTQTRLFHFDPTAPGQPTWQGHSVAAWQYGPSTRGAARTGNLKVVTTNLRAGYVRRNGAPYSDKAVVTEYYDLNTMPNDDLWMTVTTRVDDPVYFSRPLINTTDFKKLPDNTGWNPAPCTTK